MNKVFAILIMILLAIDAKGIEINMCVSPEDTSPAIIKEAETAIIQFSQRQSRRKRRSRSSSKENNNEQVKHTVQNVQVTPEPIVVRVSLDTLTTDYVAQDGEVISGRLGAYQLTIADGATITLEGVDITRIPNRPVHPFAGITCAGDATIILATGMTSKVKGGYENYPGILAAEGKTLTIKGTGALEASSQGWAAGIGGGKDLACGNIVIEGGTIKAVGGRCAAAIGSGWFGSCGDIIIQPTVKSITLSRHKSGGTSIGAGLDGSCGTVAVADEAQVINETH